MMLIKGRKVLLMSRIKNKFILKIILRFVYSIKIFKKNHRIDKDNLIQIVDILRLYNRRIKIQDKHYVYSEMSNIIDIIDSDYVIHIDVDDMFIVLHDIIRHNKFKLNIKNYDYKEGDIYYLRLITSMTDKMFNDIFKKYFLDLDKI